MERSYHASTARFASRAGRGRTPEGFRNPAQPAPDLMLVGARRPANLSGLLFVVVLGLNLLLLLEYWLGLFGHLSLCQPQPDLRHMGSCNPRFRSLNVPAISRHCCARRRYSSALLATAYCPCVR